MNGLGMNPGLIGQGPSTVSQVQAQSPLAAQEAARKRAAALAQLAAASNVPIPGVSGGNSHMMFDPGQGGTYSAPTPDSGDGGILGFLGDVGSGALDLLNQGRSAVASGVKEATDAFAASDVGRWLGTGNHVPDWLITQRTNAEYDQHLKDIGAVGGWENADFKRQFNERKGVGDYLTEINPNRSLGFRRTMGFIGDIGTDPLTYLSLGGETAIAKGGGAVDKGIAAAAESGGRTTMAKAVAQRAADVGLESEAKNLVSEVARRGRGAITKQGLERAGIDAAMAETLGIPKLTREFVGLEIPGSAKIAAGVENTKGAVKNLLGSNGAAKFWRTLRVSDKLGEKAFLDILRDSKSPADRVLFATHALAANTAGTAAGGKWGGEWGARIMGSLGDMRKLSESARASVTHAAESDVLHAVDTLPGKFRAALSGMRQSMVDMGIEVGHLGDNYVPHLPTDAAMKSGNEEIARIVSKADSKKFFENARTLNKGDHLLGIELKKGTIEEINGITTAKLGFKLFEDDAAKLVGAYVTQGSKAVQMKTIRDGLEKAGVALKANVKHALDDSQVAEHTARTLEATAARDAQTIALRDGSNIRFDQAKTVRKELGKRIGKAQGELTKLRQGIATAQRDITAWESRIATLEQDLPHLEQALQNEAAIARKARGVAKQKSSARLTKMQAALDAKLAEKAALEKRLAGLPKGGTMARVGRAEISDVSRTMAVLESDLAGMQADHAALSVADLGQAGVPGEQGYADLSYHIQGLNDQISKDSAAVLDQRWGITTREDQIAILDSKIAEMERGVSLGKQATKKGGSFNKGMNEVDHAALKTHVNQVRKALESVSEQTDPTVRALLDQEARAAIFDTQAALHGARAVSLEDMIRTMEHPDFGKLISHTADDGYSLWGKDVQVPSWLMDKYEVAHQLRQPDFWTDVSKFYKGAQNVWKGWAIARPGFIVRNVYSSLFNTYLEGGMGAIKSLRKFEKFYRIFEKNPDNYMEVALQHFHDPALVKQMDEALNVMYATGGGQAANEVKHQLLVKSNFNPLSAENKAIRATRHVNENFESVVRGAHAFDVLQRGGDLNTATDIVTKWHFNYSNPTQFDRVMKNVIPFWSFMSNNIALQAHVFTHNLGKLNRTYFNLVRNMGLDQPQEKNMPSYLSMQNPIPLDINPQGTSTYATPGLPSMDFLNMGQQAVSNPGALAGNLAPWIGLPLEGIAGKNLFTGRPLTGAVDAGIFGAIPGLGDTTGSGGTAISPYQRDILTGLLPPFSSANRMVDKGAPSVAAWLGFSTAQLTPSQRKGIAYGQQKADSAAAAKRKLLATM